MPSRLDARLRRLEAQSQAREGPHGQGISAVLADARRLGITGDPVPLASLTAATLDEKIAALTGARGLSLLWLAHLEEERARRQACAEEPPV